MSKRVIITVGDARVGKSTVIKLLLEMLVLKRKRIKVYSHDTFCVFKAYENLVPIEHFNLLNDETDQIADELKNCQLDIIIIEMPGQYIEKITQYIESTSLFEVVVRFGWKLTFLQPISQRNNCLDYLNQIIETASNNANYVVVKNYHFSPEFREYDEKIPKKLLVIGGTEIELPPLHRNHYQMMDKLVKPYSECCHDISLILFLRSFIYQWIKKFQISVSKNNLAISYLGLD
ncbi:hypothetical protein WKK05_39135 (plasmid) [Nostoc sp. UHCC 0302]|uniref:hypothetical protein n=1 Tax=Nostoc sp. UHCC 0302 TaxID=3134896 RepID=UPI00311CC01E